MEPTAFSSPPPPVEASRWKSELILIIVVSVLIRLGALFWASTASGGDVSLYLSKCDAPSYIELARMMHTGTRPVDSWHERVYWGWVLLIAPFGAHERVLGHAAIWLGIGLATLASVLFWWLTKDIWLSVLFTAVPPAWVMHSCNAMSEPAYLACLLTSLLMFVRGSIGWSGAAMGYAALVRPTAVFLYLPMVVELVRRRRWLAVLSFSILAALGPAATIGLNAFYYGDATHQSRLHGDPQNFPAGAAEILAGDGPTRTYGYWPFKALLDTPRLIPTPKWKIVYVYANVAILLAACFVAAVRFRQDDMLGRICAAWLWGNALFILSTGPYWGFHSFDRYFVWAWPALAYQCKGLPGLKRASLVLGSVSIVLATWALSRRF